MFFLKFPETIQKSYFKRKPSMNVRYFIKEHPWKNAFDATTLKKIGEVNPLQSCPCTTVVAAAMILEVVNN